MLSVVIPVTHPEPALVDTLAALVPAAADGLLRDVLLAGAAESDFLQRVADAAGCGLLPIAGGRAAAVASGARQVKGPWVLVLEPGLVPGGDWMAETEAFIEEAGDGDAAAYSLAPRGPLRQQIRSHAINWRCQLTGRAHPLQGLVAGRDILAQGRPVKAARLASPVHDRRGRVRTR
ncbi:MAG: glycosyl transferase [Alsobacter sp.]